MGFVVSGWVDPWLPAAQRQHEIVGGVLPVAAMQFAGSGYTTVVDGHLFPRGIEGLAVAFARRSVPLHYVVLRALISPPVRARVRSRGEGRWPLDSGTSTSCTPSSPRSAPTSLTSSTLRALPRMSPPVYSRHLGRQARGERPTLRRIGLGRRRACVPSRVAQHERLRGGDRGVTSSLRTTHPRGLGRRRIGPVRGRVGRHRAICRPPQATR